MFENRSVRSRHSLPSAVHLLTQSGCETRGAGLVDSSEVLANGDSIRSMTVIGNRTLVSG